MREAKWYDAYIAITAISVLPNLLLILIPSKFLQNKGNGSSLNVQNLMISFASAGLIGDVFLHTLPHLLAPHSHSHGTDHSDEHADAHRELHSVHHEHGSEHHGHDHDHAHEHDHHGHAHGHDQHHEHHSSHDFHGHMEAMDGNHAHDSLTEQSHGHSHEQDEHNETGAFYASLGMERVMVISLALILGFMVFMFAEKFANYSHGGGHSHAHGGHHHNHSSSNSTDSVDEGATTASAATAGGRSTSSLGQRKSSRLSKQKNAKENDEGSCNEEEDEGDSKTRSTGGGLFSVMQHNLKPSGWLNLLADGMHNFTDGIAVGASFASGRGLAQATVLSVIFHEIPHEIGDFSILLQAGLRYVMPCHVMLRCVVLLTTPSLHVCLYDVSYVLVPTLTFTFVCCVSC
jgi:solute carrier family 39 (zinc transporter), member 7